MLFSEKLLPNSAFFEFFSGLPFLQLNLPDYMWAWLMKDLHKAVCVITLL